MTTDFSIEDIRKAFGIEKNTARITIVSKNTNKAYKRTKNRRIRKKIIKEMYARSFEAEIKEKNNESN